MTLLEVTDLKISIDNKEIVKGISFTLDKGEVLALVGESGSGKTLTALSLTKLLPQAQVSGRVWLEQRDLIQYPERNLWDIRGKRIGYIFQEPMSSLNPLHSIGRQIAETLQIHTGMDKEAITARVLELLDLVGFPEGKERLHALPHELSGGQRQRVMIAQALANNPDIIIADEPTTALDVTIQKQIIELLKDLQKRPNLSILFITHDLGIVNAIADKIAVMKDGVIVETGTREEVIKSPQYEYTKELISSYNTTYKREKKSTSSYILEAENISVKFPMAKKQEFTAVDGVSFKLSPGETIGIVGESGSGKTTLAMALLRLQKKQGKIYFNGADISWLSGKELRPYRKNMQVVFQDPYASLNPRRTVMQTLSEGLDIHFSHLDKEQKEAEIIKTLNIVGLNGEQDKDKYPHEFSGGQRQRIAIARAIILKPQLIILDEPSSSLDMSLRSQIMGLLKDLQKEFSMSYIFISHDMNTIRAMCDRIMVMKDGKIVEQGSNEDIFSKPKEKYTKTLINSSFGFNL